MAIDHVLHHRGRRLPASQLVVRIAKHGDRNRGGGRWLRAVSDLGDRGDLRLEVGTSLDEERRISGEEEFPVQARGGAHRARPGPPYQLALVRLPGEARAGQELPPRVDVAFEFRSRGQMKTLVQPDRILPKDVRPMKLT